jgi:HEAT repeat
VAEPDVLDGVDDIPWPDLSHAYGAAGDVPALLRALTSASEEAGEAFDTLCGSICHQGSVYSATRYAVPFLAKIAVAGIRTVAVLGSLGGIAGSDDERGLEVPGAARAAVAGQIGVLAPLLADPDAEVRATAVWALTQCQAPG